MTVAKLIDALTFTSHKNAAKALIFTNLPRDGLLVCPGSSSCLVVMYDAGEWHVTKVNNETHQATPLWSRVHIGRAWSPRSSGCRGQRPWGLRPKCKCPNMGADPVGKRLTPGGLGVGEVAGAKHRHEHRSLVDFSRGGIKDGKRLAAVVDKELLSRPVFLAHGEIEPLVPLAVEVAEVAVLVP